MTGRRSRLALAAVGLVVLAGAAALVGGPAAVGADAAGALTTAGEGPRAWAVPATPGAIAAHDVSAGTRATPHGDPRTNEYEPNSSVRAIRLRYPPGSNVSLSRVEPGDVRAYVTRDAGTADARREPLEPRSVSVGPDAVTVRVEDPPELGPDDAVGLRVTAVRNPPASGRVPVAVTLVTPEGDRTTARATIDIRPKPRLTDRGDRLAVSWPADAPGFLVVRTADGRTVEVTRRFDGDTGARSEVPYEDFLEPGGFETSVPLRLNVTAYRDVDGDGTFDPAVDRPFRRGGDPVSVVEPVTARTETTTLTTISTGTTPTTTTATAGAGDARAGGPTATGNGPAAATPPGDGDPLAPAGTTGPAAVFGVCAAIVAVVLAARRVRPGG